jgi:hypothetical protein
MPSMADEPLRPQCVPVDEDKTVLAMFNVALAAFDPSKPKTSQFTTFSKWGAAFADRKLEVYRVYCEYAIRTIKQLVHVVGNKDSLIKIVDDKVVSLNNVVDDLARSAPDGLEQRLGQLRDAAQAADDAFERAGKRMALEDKNLELLSEAMSEGESGQFLSSLDIFMSEANLFRAQSDLRAVEAKLDQDRRALQADRAQFCLEQKAWVNKARESDPDVQLALSSYFQGVHCTFKGTVAEPGMFDFPRVAVFNCGAVVWSAEASDGKPPRLIKNAEHPYWVARAFVRWLKEGDHLSTEGDVWYEADVEREHRLYLRFPYSKKPPLWSWFAGIEDEVNGVDPSGLPFEKGTPVPPGKRFEEFDLKWA